MLDFIQSIIDDPGENWPILVMGAAVPVLWVGLCFSAIISLVGTLRRRTTGRRRRFWLALIPLLVGSAALLAEISYSVAENGVQQTVDFRWLFLLPLFLSAAALILWWRARQSSQDASSPATSPLIGNR